MREDEDAPFWLVGDSFLVQSGTTCLGGRFKDLHGATTFRRTAMARRDPPAGAIEIVDSKFFSRGNLAKAEKENAAANDASAKIRIAAMINTLGAGAPDFSIHSPIAIEVVHIAWNAPVALENTPQALEESEAGTNLTGVFDDFGTGGNILFSKNSDSMNL